MKHFKEGSMGWEKWLDELESMLVWEAWVQFMMFQSPLGMSEHKQYQHYHYHHHHHHQQQQQQQHIQ